MSVEPQTAPTRLPREFEHELMNLLSVVIGHADLIEILGHDPRQRESAAAIRRASERAIALARNWPG